MKTIQHWCIICTTFLLLGCDSSYQTRQVEGLKQFRTTAPSQLYFKNMRSYYYQQTETTAKMNHYEAPKLLAQTDRPLLLPTIVENWLEDEAYIRISPNFAWPTDRPLTVHWSAEQQEGQFALATDSYVAHYQFAEQLYQHIAKGSQLWLVPEATQQPIFTEPADRTVFLQVMRDYYKLTETL